jgi:hypothetical protein
MLRMVPSLVRATPLAGIVEQLANAGAVDWPRAVIRRLRGKPGGAVEFRFLHADILQRCRHAKIPGNIIQSLGCVGVREQRERPRHAR